MTRVGRLINNYTVIIRLKTVLLRLFRGLLNKIGSFRYGWPEDLWFHVDDLSSAHVYLRLPRGDSFETVPEEVVEECASLVKANSIKVLDYTIFIWPWVTLWGATLRNLPRVSLMRKLIRLNVLRDAK